MEGNRPKRRKDKYNPYTIFEKDGQYYVSFKDGQGVSHKLEISKVLYDTFDSFELSDLVYLNVVDRHIEQSEVWENTLNMRAMKSRTAWRKSCSADFRQKSYIRQSTNCRKNRRKG